VIAVRAKFPPEAAQRLKTIRVTPLREPRAGEPKPPPLGEADPAVRDTSPAGDEDRARLDPSARLALVAARLAGRDRHVG